MKYLNEDIEANSTTSTSTSEKKKIGIRNIFYIYKLLQ